jgi:hypothetical protein
LETLTDQKCGAHQISSLPDLLTFTQAEMTKSPGLKMHNLASTRDPTDLVGRSLYVSKGGDDVVVQIGGRGITGKFVTGKAKK